MAAGGEREAYDLLVFTRRRSVMDHGDRPVEWEELGLELHDVRDRLRRLRVEGGLGIVVPARYRHASVSREHARRVAFVALSERRQREGGAFGELSDGEDGGAYWVFTADDYAAQERGYIPGTASFYVDKLNGQLWSLAEETAFRALSTRSD